MGIHNPLPSSMESECRKCSKILASFIDPNQAFSPDKFIPSSILANARGLAILTVVKAGFLGSARYGNGVVVARLRDGTWSAPSAIGTGGAGLGGQIGFELTDFVFILNDRAAVRTFSQVGSLTLGGNVSVAAGPVGRNAEAAGAASLRSVAGIFSYSKTRGFFAGVSLEGSMIVERRDANERLYGRRYTAHQILNGVVPIPSAAQPLTNILNSKTFAGITVPLVEKTSSNSSPVQENYNGKNDMSYQMPGRSKRRSVFRENFAKNRYSRMVGRDPHNSYSSRHSFDNYRPRSSEKRYKSRHSMDDYKPTQIEKSYRPRHSIDGFYSKPIKRTSIDNNGDDIYSEKPKTILKQAHLKPMFPSLKKNEAIAIHNFEADQPGDLGFKKGDIITVTQSSRSRNDWWTGMTGNQTGIFPAKYVEMKK